jgi:hypothetical protein
LATGCGIGVAVAGYGAIAAAVLSDPRGNALLPRPGAANAVARMRAGTAAPSGIPDDPAPNGNRELRRTPAATATAAVLREGVGGRVAPRTRARVPVQAALSRRSLLLWAVGAGGGWVLLSGAMRYDCVGARHLDSAGHSVLAPQVH